MIGQYRRGHADSQPYLVEDEGTGQLVPVFLPGDALNIETPKAIVRTVV